MNKRFAVLFVIVVTFVGHAAAQTCTPYDQLPAPSSPGELMQDLDAALKNGCQVWKWRNHWTANHQNFSNFNAGSQNLPVVAGAIALIRDANKAPAVNFFTTLLTCQNSPASCPTSNGQPSISHFKGKEILSNTYDFSVVNAVLVVNWWSHKNPGVAGALTLQPLARGYLRKTWSIYALAAGKTWARDLADDNTAGGLNTGNGCGQHVFTCNINPNNGNLFFSGPFLALAGLRSKPGSRACYDYRAVLFAYAINWNGGSFKNDAEHQSQAAIRTFITANWPGNPSGENVFALNAAEQQIVKDHIQLGNTTHVATLVGVISNGGSRFYVPMHFVGWNDGARLSYLDYHTNNNPGGTVYALKFEPVSQRAHLHYPFHASKNGPYRVANFGQVLIGTNLNPGCGFPTSEHLETWNQPCSTPAPSGDCKHEERRLWMPMPTSTKIYEVVIDQAGARRVF